MEVRKPKDEEDPNGMGGNLFFHNAHAPGIMTVVRDSPHKVFVGSLPVYLEDEQVMELLKAFGPLRSFSLIRDSVTGLSKGFAFCEYMDPDLADVAIKGLNGMEIGDKKLIMQRSAATGFRLPEVGPEDTDLPMLPVEILSAISKTKVEPTNVLMLLNMVSEEDLSDYKDYEGASLGSSHSQRNLPRRYGRV